MVNLKVSAGKSQKCRGERKKPTGMAARGLVMIRGYLLRRQTACFRGWVLVFVLGPRAIAHSHRLDHVEGNAPSGGGRRNDVGLIGLRRRVRALGEHPICRGGGVEPGNVGGPPPA